MSSPEPGVLIEDGVDVLSVAVVAAIQANEPWPDQEYEPPTCWICDGAGHGYVVGWENVPGKGDVPILASPCPLETPGGYGFGDYEEEPW
jgi:hypothetical protein